MFVNRTMVVKIGSKTSQIIESNTILSDILKNKATSNTAAAGKILIVGSSLSGGVFPMCSHIAFSMVKIFQVIEILAKLFYLPVVFSGNMDTILSAISELGDPIEISPNILISDKLEDGYMNYKGKIFKFEEFANILQSMPISTSFYMLLELVLLISNSMKCFNKGKRVYQLVSSIRIFFIEISVIDLWFYAILNITLYPRISNKNLLSTTSFVIALYILFTTIYQYMNSFFQAKLFLERGTRQNLLGVEDHIVNISFEGLRHIQLIRISNRELKKPKPEQEEIISLKSLHDSDITHLKRIIIFNFLFRFQMLFIPIVIIAG